MENESREAPKSLDEAEREAILAALRSTGGSCSKAARVLKCDRKTLYAKMRKYGIRIERPAARVVDTESGAG